MEETAPYLKVKDKNNLVRDTYTNAIINTDMDGYNNYVETYRIKYNEKKRIENLESDVGTIKDDLNEIKQLLRNLANGS
jgi:glycine betaine/choline ABC-type transport system substrate-binding protein